MCDRVRLAVTLHFDNLLHPLIYMTKGRETDISTVLSDQTSSSIDFNRLTSDIIAPEWTLSQSIRHELD